MMSTTMMTMTMIITDSGHDVSSELNAVFSLLTQTATFATTTTAMTTRTTYNYDDDGVTMVTPFCGNGHSFFTVQCGGLLVHTDYDVCSENDSNDDEDNLQL